MDRLNAPMRARTQAKVAAHKARHPDQFCPHPRCLWYTRGGPCPRHLSASRVGVSVMLVSAGLARWHRVPVRLEAGDSLVEFMAHARELFAMRASW